MYHNPKENNMYIEKPDCIIQVSCDNLKMFNELHEAIDRVLMNYYTTPEIRGDE